MSYTKLPSKPLAKGLPLNDEVMIKVESVGKTFCRDLKRSLWYGLKDSFGELFPGRYRKLSNNGKPVLRRDEFWANQEISFELRRGECLGLIGHNGAGKTTLLKMLNGLIKPDTGTITMKGRVGALIALGAGFNPILTGRENVYVNGAVLGLSKSEIDEKFDEIIEFAEIGEFIDAPVQTYSSGMQVRLGFAVATTINPEILLVDEVLAVGDARFRMKCVERISKLVHSNTAVILVSHSMTNIQRVCTRTIVMAAGTINYDGSVTGGVSAYEKLALTSRVGNADEISPHTDEVIVLETTTIRTTSNVFVEGAYEIETGDPITVGISLKASQELKDGRLRVYVESSTGEILASITTLGSGRVEKISEGPQELILNIERFPFLRGVYGVGVSFHQGDHTLLIPARRIGLIRVVAPPVKPSAKTDAGLVSLDTSWEVVRK